jgi:hypothetical protein
MIFSLGQDVYPRFWLLRHQYCVAHLQFIPPMLEQLSPASLVIGFIMAWDNIINMCYTTN